MPEMVLHAKNVAANIDIPLITDAENGFYHAANIWRTVKEFEAAGVCAIHIEDHEFGKHTHLKPVLLEPEQMVKKIKAALDARTDKDFMIFARTDAAWAFKDMEEAVRRANIYLGAGADAAFLAVASTSLTPELRARINGPVVITNAGDNSLELESKAGVNISLYWPMLLYAAFVACKETCELFKETRDYTKLGKYQFNELEFNKYIPFKEFLERADKYL
jgi:2-methylisocitrate lyase-like PEP mutase family enzyme